MSDYTAKDIKVLGEAALEERFLWKHAEALAREYPYVAPAFIGRLVEACTLSGWPVEQAVQRYLREDRSVLVPAEFTAVFSELVKQAQYR